MFFQIQKFDHHILFQSLQKINILRLINFFFTRLNSSLGRGDDGKHSIASKYNH